MMMKLIDYMMYFYGGVTFIYMLFVILAYSLMLFFAFIQLRKQYQLDKMELDEDYIDLLYTKPISIDRPSV